MMKRTNSAMSALRNAIMPNVQTIEITTSAQDNQDAWSIIVVTQFELSGKNRWFSGHENAARKGRKISFGWIERRG